ncbi:hypothetical protein Tco_0678114 [Tanacetum coccineum]|uniref:Uncharacterized protein n=1 Tax=Tanacetum coccineum TaxID=301880 RepID=A0ABQ4XF91_9ASTR
MWIKPRSNTKKNRILPAKKENKKEVEVTPWTKVYRSCIVSGHRLFKNMTGKSFKAHGILWETVQSSSVKGFGHNLFSVFGFLKWPSERHTCLMFVDRKGHDILKRFGHHYLGMLIQRNPIKLISHQIISEDGPKIIPCDTSLAILRLYLPENRMDVNIALNGDLQEDVFVSQLKGFEDQENLYLTIIVEKAFMGLKQAPRRGMTHFQSSVGNKFLLRVSWNPTVIKLTPNQANILLVQYGMDLSDPCRYTNGGSIETGQDFSWGFQLNQLESEDVVGSLMYLTRSRPQPCIRTHAALVSWRIDWLVVTKKQESTGNINTEAENTSYVGCGGSNPLDCDHSSKTTGFDFNNILVTVINKSAIALCVTYVQHSRSKHIEHNGTISSESKWKIEWLNSTCGLANHKSISLQTFSQSITKENVDLNQTRVTSVFNQSWNDMTLINAEVLSNFVSLQCLSSLLNALLQNTDAEQLMKAFGRSDKPRQPSSANAVGEKSSLKNNVVHAELIWEAFTQRESQTFSHTKQVTTPVAEPKEESNSSPSFHMEYLEEMVAENTKKTLKKCIALQPATTACTPKKPTTHPQSNQSKQLLLRQRTFPSVKLHRSEKGKATFKLLKGEGEGDDDDMDELLSFACPAFCHKVVIKLLMISNNGPSSQPEDDTSEKVIHESSSTSDSERTESETETAAPKGDKDQGEVDSSTVTSGVSIPVSDPEKAHEALAGPDPEPMKEEPDWIRLWKITYDVLTLGINFIMTNNREADQEKSKVRERVCSTIPDPKSFNIIQNQESEKSPKEIIIIKKEQGEEKQDSTYSIRSTDKVDLEEFDLKTLIADEDAIDKEVADKVRSGSVKPPTKDDEQSSKKPRESDASASKQHPALTSTGWQITDIEMLGVDSSMHKIWIRIRTILASSDNIPMQDEGNESDMEDTDIEDNVYMSLSNHFWRSAEASTDDNREVQITATIDEFSLSNWPPNGISTTDSDKRKQVLKLITFIQEVTPNEVIQIKTEGKRETRELFEVSTRLGAQNKRLSFAEAIRLEEQMNEEQRAQIARDEEIARQWDISVVALLNTFADRVWDKFILLSQEMISMMLEKGNWRLDQESSLAFEF